MSIKFNLNFHQTFAPEREYLSKLLDLANGMSPMTKEEIFQQTGIPTGKSSGKVEPHIKYAIFMGLVTDKAENGTHILERTAFGEIVYKVDPHLLEPLTLLVCHYNICNPLSGAALWKFLFQKAIPTFGLSIKQDTLANAASIEFAVSKVNLTPLKVCYTTEKCLGSIGLLEVLPDKVWKFKSIPYKSDFRYVYVYTLLKTWEELLNDRMELTIDELITYLNWNQPFIWDERTVINILDALSEIGVLTLNKQLTPITIIRRATSDEALANLYRYII